MVTALIITWLFWGLLIALEIYWKRVWYLWLFPPLVLSGVWIIVNLFSSQIPLYLSIAIHLGLIVWGGVRIVQDKGPNEWRRPKEPGEI